MSGGRPGLAAPAGGMADEVVLGARDRVAPPPLLPLESFFAMGVTINNTARGGLGSGVCGVSD